MILVSTAISSLLLDKEVQHQEARHCERYKENSQQRDVRPPERLRTHQPRFTKNISKKKTYLCTETKYRQDRSSGHIQLDSVLYIHLLVKG